MAKANKTSVIDGADDTDTQDAGAIAGDAAVVKDETDQLAGASTPKLVRVRALLIIEHAKVRHIPESKNQDFEMPEDVALPLIAKGYLQRLDA